MNDDTPTYLTDANWDGLIEAMNSNEALRLKLGVQLCPATGMVEEYMVADQLGGMLNLWPEKWRHIIDSDRQSLAA